MTTLSILERETSRQATWEPPAEVVWVPDDSVKRCHLCQDKFNFTRRKHHCRKCGFIFCHKCSNRKMRNECGVMKRICLECFRAARQLEITLRDTKQVQSEEIKRIARLSIPTLHRPGRRRSIRPKKGSDQKGRAAENIAHNPNMPPTMRTDTAGEKETESDLKDARQSIEKAAKATPSGFTDDLILQFFQVARVKTRRWTRPVPDVFHGSQVVVWLRWRGIKKDFVVPLGNYMIQQGLLEQITGEGKLHKDQIFKNRRMFYRFTEKMHTMANLAKVDNQSAQLVEEHKRDTVTKEKEEEKSGYWCNEHLDSSSDSSDSENDAAPVIIDHGAYSIRFGVYTKKYIPSRHIRTSKIETSKGAVFGVPRDQKNKAAWTAIVEQWRCLCNELQIDPTSRRFLVSKNVGQPQSQEASILKALLEELKVQAAHVIPAPLLCAYSYGQYTALVIDMGHSALRVVPVINGIMHTGGMIVANHLSGEAMTKCMLHLLEESETSCLQNIYVPALRKNIANQIKEKHACVALDFKTSTNDTKYNAEVEVSSTLDTRTFTMRTELLTCGEMLFDPATILQHDELASITEVVYKCITCCPLDSRAALLACVCPCGGASMLPGLFPRLEAELKTRYESVPKMADAVRLRCDPNRAHTVWTGGAVVTSLPAFQARWVTATGEPWVPNKRPRDRDDDYSSDSDSDSDSDSSDSSSDPEDYLPQSTQPTQPTKLAQVDEVFGLESSASATGVKQSVSMVSFTATRPNLSAKAASFSFSDH